MDSIKKHRSHINGMQRCIRWWEKKRWIKELKEIKESINICCQGCSYFLEHCGIRECAGEKEKVTNELRKNCPCFECLIKITCISRCDQREKYFQSLMKQGIR